MFFFIARRAVIIIVQLLYFLNSKTKVATRAFFSLGTFSPYMVYSF
ncbi:MAG: hypothetical protein MRERV_35c030 [Mycoplasmataceae bacterium RV_VA103A]|nr:MAG: hypothetical protein MRERV_35c030 [Mycoplasmataceae bacterium RV_VA103A]